MPSLLLHPAVVVHVAVRDGKRQVWWCVSFPATGKSSESVVKEETPCFFVSLIKAGSPHVQQCGSFKLLKPEWYSTLVRQVKNKAFCISSYVLL